MSLLYNYKFCSLISDALEWQCQNITGLEDDLVSGEFHNTGRANIATHYFSLMQPFLHDRGGHPLFEGIMKGKGLGFKFGIRKRYIYSLIYRIITPTYWSSNAIQYIAQSANPCIRSSIFWVSPI